MVTCLGVVKFISILLFLKFLEGFAAEDHWDGKWFPAKPTKIAELLAQRIRTPMGIRNPKCDDAMNNLEIDFDPNSYSNKVVYICFGNHSAYRPDYNVQPIMKEHLIPPAYMAPHKCMNESINYVERLPTYGPHRPLWARYGQYKYLPIQRWMHNLEHGAVVMLYHPCADERQVEKFQTLVKNCLFRHVITPSKLLFPERPLALIVWGKTLEMSVVESKVVIEFIRSYALHGPEQTSTDGQYDHLLLQPAKTVSDQDDSRLCPKY